MKPSNALEILQQEGVLPPKTLTLAITGACNLSCSHCWVEAGVSDSAGHVPWRTLRRLVEEFAAIGGRGLRITGGEPLCHPDWLELMRLSRRAGFRDVYLQTNGMLFTAGHAAALRELDFPGLSVQVSLDGATAATHDLVRGTGAFKGALDGIRLLADGGLAQRITVFFTEMRHNLPEIPALLELAEAMGIASVVTGALVLGGRAAEGSLVAPADPAQYLCLLQRFDADPRFRSLYDKIGKMAALEWRTGAAPRSECCTFVENPYLTSSGRMYPCVLCHADDFAVSGLFEKGLAEGFAEGARLWSSLLRISRGRADAIAGCRDCPGGPACAGGCMGRAWGSCGDLLTADDRCGLRRTIYQKQCLSHP